MQCVEPVTSSGVEGRSTRRRLRSITCLLLLLIVAFLALAGRCLYLQHFKTDCYVDACLKQRSYYPQTPQRGVILDRRGRVFAASNRIQTIFAEPRAVKNPRNTSNKLAPLIDMGAHEICKLIMESKNPGFARIKADAEVQECDAASRIHGIGVQHDWRRHYPMERLAAHVVGFTSTDNRGWGGIEFQYDEELSGSPGRDIFLADVHRRPIRPAPAVPLQLTSARTEFTAPQLAFNGCGIILTLDAAIQQFAQAELINQYQSYEAESAIAIVAEPKTGAILALVSLPDFEPNEARCTDPNVLCNRAITDQFEPGSILKPIVAAIAMDAGVINGQEKIFCENGDYRGKGFGRIGEYRRGFGDLTVRDILVHSSNIGMAKIGQKLGKDRLYRGLKLFGFGEKIGIDLPGEAAGLLRAPRDWTGYSVTRIPFGQEISVTSIQLVQAFCILANGGRLVHPYLVKAMIDNNGKTIKGPVLRKDSKTGEFVLKGQSPPVGYIIKREVAEWIVADAMAGVVSEGTGKRAKLEKYQVFGKSGTAQLAKTDGGGYTEDDYIASFVAGAPVENPAVVVLVSIRKPNVKLGKGYTGGVVAAPVAAAILEKTLNYLGARDLRGETRIARHE
jgi:cell division protein FtsI/penicillin-binding protein 2